MHEDANLRKLSKVSPRAEGRFQITEVVCSPSPNEMWSHCFQHCRMQQNSFVKKEIFIRCFFRSSHFSYCFFMPMVSVACCWQSSRPSSHVKQLPRGLIGFPYACEYSYDPICVLIWSCAFVCFCILKEPS